MKGRRLGRPEATQARVAFGHDVGDGAASAKAIAAIWGAVDEGALRLVAIGRRPRKIIRLDPDFTRVVPLLRRVQAFTYLRPSHREWKQVTGWFGTDLSSVVLAVRETEGTTAATHAGATPHLASALLDHRDPSTTQEHYNRASSLSAGKEYSDILEAYRNTSLDVTLCA